MNRSLLFGYRKRHGEHPCLNRQKYLIAHGANLLVDVTIIVYIVLIGITGSDPSKYRVIHLTGMRVGRSFGRRSVIRLIISRWFGGIRSGRNAVVIFGLFLRIGGIVIGFRFSKGTVSSISSLVVLPESSVTVPDASSETTVWVLSVLVPVT